MTKAQCRTADWESQGQIDGLRGLPSAQFDRHVKACERADIVPDKQAWQVGYEAGIERFCQPDSAFERGENGLTYQNVCPGGSHDLFKRVYAVGYEKYNLKARRDNIQQKISNYRREIENTREFLVSKDIDASQIKKALRDLRWKRDYEESNLRSAQYDLDRYNSRLATEGYLSMAGINVTTTYTFSKK
ncbi:MAG: DUF2799 domain-containing protein [Rhizobiaceae bacterium]